MIYTETGALLSDLLYRYQLTRVWDATKPRMMTIGINPSIANAKDDDQTIRKEVGFAQRCGFGSLEKVNLYAYITPHVRVLRQTHRLGGDIVGRDNDYTIMESARRAGLIVAAWGPKKWAKGRAHDVLAMIRREFPVYAFKLSKDGYPCHTLMLPYKLAPVLWLPRSA